MFSPSSVEVVGRERAWLLVEAINFIIFFFFFFFFLRKDTCPPNHINVTNNWNEEKEVRTGVGKDYTTTRGGCYRYKSMYIALVAVLVRLVVLH